MEKVENPVIQIALLNVLHVCAQESFAPKSSVIEITFMSYQRKAELKIAWSFFQRTSDPIYY